MKLPVSNKIVVSLESSYIFRSHMCVFGWSDLTWPFYLSVFTWYYKLECISPGSPGEVNQDALVGNWQADPQHQCSVSFKALVLPVD